MSAERKETVVDIVAEMRGYFGPLADPRTSGDCAGWDMAGDAMGYADRIEEAAKRERETVTNCNGLGNVAELRAALERILQSFAADHYGSEGALSVGEIFALAQAALAAPARNCDVFKTKKAAIRAYLHEAATAKAETDDVIVWILSPTKQEGGK